jgi:hypothetical protein
VDAATLQQYQREIMQARTRRELDALTRAIWKAHDQSVNTDALAQIGRAIEAKRDILARNQPAVSR